MNKNDIEKMACILNEAEHKKQEIDKFTLFNTELSVAEAYDIQYALTALKYSEGKRLIGLKMGLTSDAKMKQMNVDNPIYGQLFDYMRLNDHDELHMNELIHPKVEPEIAFIMGKDLYGNSLTIEDVLDAVEYVTVAIEIIDSRYLDFKFTLTDVIADNSSASRFVLGNRMCKPENFKLELLGALLSINGRVVEHGAGAAILDHPANSVIMLAKILYERNQRIESGQIILTGGITNAVHIKRSDIITAEIENLGSITLAVVD